MNNQDEVHVVKPDPSVFGGSEHVINREYLAPKQTFYVAEKIEYPPEGGIYVHYKGMPYPRKGFPFPEAMYLNDIHKRVSVTIAKSILSKDMLLPMSIFAFYPWKKKIKVANNFITNYCRVGTWVAGSYTLLDEKMSYCCRALNDIINLFMKNLDMPIGHKFAKTIATIVEYDDQYRYRIEDLASETSRKALLSNPRKEIGRILEIYTQREQTHAVELFTMILKAFRLMLLHPKVYKQFVHTLQSITDEQFDRLKLDTADRYHVLMIDGYEYLGKTLEERMEIYKKIHPNGTYPPTVEITA